MQRDQGTRSPAARVYRRRRLSVLGAVIATIALIAWALVGGSGGGTSGMEQSPAGNQEPAAGVTTGGQPRSPAPQATVTVTARPTVTVTRTSGREKQQRRGRQHKPCREAVKKLAAKTSKKAYGKEEKPVLKIRAVVKKRCLLDPDRLKVVVTSGAEQIWSSEDCPGRGRLPRRVTPKHPYKTALTWQKERSNPAKCDKKKQAVGAGWYVVTVTFSGKSAETIFRIR